jgi:hypothetical protein
MFRKRSRRSRCSVVHKAQRHEARADHTTGHMASRQRRRFDSSDVNPARLPLPGRLDVQPKPPPFQGQEGRSSGTSSHPGSMFDGPILMRHVSSRKGAFLPDQCSDFEIISFFFSSYLSQAQTLDPHISSASPSSLLYVAQSLSTVLLQKLEHLLGNNMVAFFGNVMPNSVSECNWFVPSAGLNPVLPDLGHIHLRTKVPL